MADNSASASSLLLEERPASTSVVGGSSELTLDDIEALAKAAGMDPMQFIDLALFARSKGVDADDDEVAKRVPFVEWAQRNYYITDTRAPIILLPHQIALLNCAFHETEWSRGKIFQTYVYSTIKKSGKTEIAAAVARWVVEQWGPFAEVLLCGNDREQAKSRLYQAVIHSLELTPGYDRMKRTLYDAHGEMVWRVIERLLDYCNGGNMHAVSGDYAGEAGANPNASFFTELWGFKSEASRRLWDELTPPPTRPNAFKWVETYAGYTNEEGPLLDLYRMICTDTMQLTCHEIPDWPNIERICNCGTTRGCCPGHNVGFGLNDRLGRSDPDGLPVYVNERAGLFAYWDVGERARRMPWQTQEYYAVQKASPGMRPATYTRLHENRWTDSEDAFISIEWWDANEDEDLRSALISRPDTLGLELTANGYTEPLVLAADAAVSSDCCALALFSRHPKYRNLPALRGAWCWYPPAGGKFDYQRTIEQMIRWLTQGCVDAVAHRGCEGAVDPNLGFFVHGTPVLDHFGMVVDVERKKTPFNIVELAYDAFQLHDMMTRLVREGVVHCFSFSQANERAIADKALETAIRDRQLPHPGSTGAQIVGLYEGAPTLVDGFREVRAHLEHANAKQLKDEDSKLRLVKRSQDSKIDLDVCLSMGRHETMRLYLE